MLKINHPAPSFAADAYSEGEIKKIHLDDFRGKWVVLLFYPADFTFVCPTELGEMAANHENFKKLNTQVLSVSTDTAFVHKAWHDSSPTISKIQFPMLADPSSAISRDYGVLIEEEGLALRGTFIIDPDGVVKSFEMNDNSIGRSSDELLRKLQAAQFVRENGGEVCPASWRPGKDTLKPGLDLVGKI